MKKYIWLAAVLVFMSACAHRGPSSTEDAAYVENDEVVTTELKEVGEFRLSDPTPPAVIDPELEEIPEDMQPHVDKWVNYFQGRGRHHMERYLARSTRYMALMKKILREQGLPEDLIYISLIESGFSSQATSHAAAVGYWQFIRGTGKRYGLEINKVVDERRDPVLATQAAGAYLKDLYGYFGSWYLAMASYNAGENRVMRAINKNYAKNFWDLVKKKKLPRETMEYVPKFIAAKMIAKNPEKFGITDIEFQDPIEFEHITVDQPVNLKQMAEKMSVEYDLLKSLNPKFRGEIAPTKKNNQLVLRIPVGSQATALVAAQSSFVKKVEYVADAGDTKWHKIKRGETLSTIARKYRTTVAALRDLNDINKKSTIRAGRRIMVPDRSGSVASAKSKKTRVVASQSNAPATEEVVDQDKIEEVSKAGVFYYVQPGDTLSVIAERYNTSVSNIRKVNNFSNRTVLKAGVKIRVPKSLKDRDDDSDSVEDNREVAQEAPQKSSGDSEKAHVVKPGENLTLIARKYGVSVQSIRKVNNLSARTVLKVGVRLVIPDDSVSVDAQPKSTQSRRLPKPTVQKPKVHIVKRGENLHLIARKYNIEVSDIKEKNKIQRASKLHVGARLMIPVASAN